MTTVHKALTNTRVFQELRVVHAIVQKHEGAAIFLPGADQLALPGHDSLYCIAIIVPVHEKVGYKGRIEMITLLGTREHDTSRKVFLMIHYVLYQRGLTGVTFPNEHTHTVVRHPLGFELLQLKIHLILQGVLLPLFFTQSGTFY